MNQLQSILNNYQKLCGYCDSIWGRVRGAYPDEIACREGCGICCELRSVNQIEAYVIRAFIRDNGIDGLNNANNINDVDNTSGINNNASDSCPFLTPPAQSCTIYPARPTICRTHGLVLRSTEFPQSQQQAASCPYNFPSVHPNDFPAELTVDIDNITKNLARLNLAFCMVSGIDMDIDSRVLLHDLF
ncbi:MAG: YkgJ family cysteine cluster protein [Chitinispirillales bacterium]|jgi:Fe-S-cluster containining protein|nr:YkgJ family cysteine cluster protein [Chitinispirillales bacterium]